MNAKIRSPNSVFVEMNYDETVSNEYVTSGYHPMWSNENIRIAIFGTVFWSWWRIFVSSHIKRGEYCWGFSENCIKLEFRNELKSVVYCIETKFRKMDVIVPNY